MGCTSSASGSNQTRSMARAINASTGVFDLLHREQYVTNVTSAVWDTYPITDTDFEGIGPGLVDMIVYAEREGVASTFQYRVRLEVKNIAGVWMDPPGGAVTLLGPIASNAAAYQISSIYTDRTKLVPAIRLVLDVQNSGGSTLAAAKMTISVATRFYGGC